jgi:hypothetical protein
MILFPSGVVFADKNYKVMPKNSKNYMLHFFFMQEKLDQIYSGINYSGR